MIDISIIILCGPRIKYLRGPQKFLLDFYKWSSLKNKRYYFIVENKVFDTLESDNDIDIGSYIINNRDNVFSSITYIKYIVINVIKLLCINKCSKVELIHCQDATYSGIIAAIVKFFTGVPYVSMIHGINSNAEVRNKHKFQIKYLLYNKMRKFVIENSNHVLYVGRETNKIIPHHLSSSQFFFGVDLSRQSSKSSSESNIQVSHNKIIFGLLTSLTKEKRVMDVLKSYSVIADDRSHILIAGEGSEIKALKHFVDELRLANHITFLGYCSNPQAFFKEIDVYISFSESEGMPMSVIEALSEGKAVIVSKISPHEEIITHHHNGLLVNSMEELADCMVEVINNKKLRDDLGSTALLDAKRFDIDIAFNNLENIYKTTIDYKEVSQ